MNDGFIVLLFYFLFISKRDTPNSLRSRFVTSSGKKRHDVEVLTRYICLSFDVLVHCEKVGERILITEAALAFDEAWSCGNFLDVIVTDAGKVVLPGGGFMKFLILL